MALVRRGAVGSMRAQHIHVDPPSIREQPFDNQGGGWDFSSRREIFFVASAKQIIFFLGPTQQEIFFGGSKKQNIFSPT